MFSTLKAFILILSQVISQIPPHSPKIDVNQLRCLVCEKSVDELIKAVNEIDPNKNVDIGGYRLDESGNYLRKTVSQSKSEIHLSELIEKVCEKMDDYARATWKTNGKLTLLKLMGDDGQLHPDFNKVDMIVDDDLNKSLQYYCEEVMNEYEDDIIINIKSNEDVKWKVCYDQSKLCTAFESKDEL